MIFSEHALMVLVAVPRRHYMSWRLVVVALLAGVYPDLEVFVIGFPGSLGYLTYHRLYTHSLVLLPLHVLLLGGLSYFALRRREPLQRVAVVTCLALLSHIALDLVNPYGMPIFYPISSTRYSLDLLVVMDPLVLSSSIAASVVLVVAFLRRKPGLACNAVRIFALLFIAQCLAVAGYKEYVKRQAERHVAQRASGTSLQRKAVRGLSTSLQRPQHLVVGSDRYSFG